MKQAKMSTIHGLILNLFIEILTESYIEFIEFSNNETINFNQTKASTDFIFYQEEKQLSNYFFLF